MKWRFKKQRKVKSVIVFQFWWYPPGTYLVHNRYVLSTYWALLCLPHMQLALTGYLMSMDLIRSMYLPDTWNVLATFLLRTYDMYQYQLPIR